MGRHDARVLADPVGERRLVSRRAGVEGPEPLLARIEQWVRRSPEAPAVLDAHGGLTYADLWARSCAVTDTLARAGIREGECVAVGTARRRELVAVLLGVWRLGASFVPVDAAWPRDRVGHILRDSCARSAVSAASDAPSFLGHGVGVLDPSGEWLQPVAGDPRAAAPRMAYVLYTSGTTGQPKGVEVSHAALFALFARNERWIDVRPGDTALSFHSLTFDVSLWELFRPLTRGARVVLCDATAMLDPRRLVDWSEAHAVTHMCQTPTAFRSFSTAAIARGAVLPSLRTVLLAGEALRFEELSSWMDAHGDERPELWNVYGPTETTVYASAHRVRMREAQEEERSLIGTALGHVRVSVDRTASDGGDVGEIVIGGEGVARGYRNLADLTREKFVVRDGVRLYRSGDLGRSTDAGEIEFLGRNDAQVKVRGYRVELEEVEHWLRRHAGVDDSVAVVLADSIVAGVVRTDGRQLDLRALRAFLADHLPMFMRPSRIVELDRIPLTQSGKIDRAAAAAVLREPT